MNSSNLQPTIPELASEIERGLRLILCPEEMGDSVAELRALHCHRKSGGPVPMGGFYDVDHLPQMATDAARLTLPHRASGVYVTLNPIHRDLLAVRANRCDVAGTGESATDTDGIRLRNLLIDVDPKRRKKISARDDEKAFGESTIRRVRARLDSAGWPEPIFADSGNGFHLVYRIDLPPEDSALIQQCLLALGQEFSDERVEIDLKVFNPSRICKIPGTWARKGDDIPERPHRQSRIIDAPDKRLIVPRESLVDLAGTAPADETQAAPVHHSAARSFPSGPGMTVPERAARYLEKLPDSIEGENGSGRCFHAACVLVQGFDLSVDQAFPILTDWSNRKAVPPWSEKELRHKLEDAAKASGERGRLLRDDRQRQAHEGSAGTWSVESSGTRPASRGRTFVPVRTCVKDVERQQIPWLWPGRIPLGCLTLLVGQPGAGKSYITMDFASRVSTATPWPDGSECPRGSVVLISAEDDPGYTIRPRLDAHHADLSRIHLLSAVRADGKERIVTLAHVDAIESTIRELPDCRLVIVDPIGSYLGGSTDAHRENEVRGVLAPIGALAQKYGVAVLMVAHRRKAHGTIADDLALGSRAFTGITRAVWHLSKDTKNKSRRLLLSGKNNLAPGQWGLAFEIVGEPASVVWERDPVQMTADDALANENRVARQPPGPKSIEAERAADWLGEALSNGPRLASELKSEWINVQDGTTATLRRAKEKLRVEATRAKIPGPWFWSLPDDPGKGIKSLGNNPNTEHLEHLEPLAKNRGNSPVFANETSKALKMFESLGESGVPDPGDDGPDLLTVAAQLEAEGMPEGDSDAWGDA